MFVIRAGQVTALDRAQHERFVDRASALVAEHWPRAHERLGPAGTRELVRRLSQQARGVGLVTPEQWLRWINVGLALGEGFADKPAVRAILRGPRSAPEKLQELVELTGRELRSAGG